MASPTHSDYRSVKTWLKSLLLSSDKHSDTGGHLNHGNVNATTIATPSTSTESPSLHPHLPSPPNTAILRRLSTSAHLISFHHAVDVSQLGTSAPPSSLDAAAPIHVPLAPASHPYRCPPLAPTDDPTFSLTPPSLTFATHHSPPPSHTNWPTPLPPSPSISKTIGQGVTSLQERLQHRRRASETFRRMRVGSDAASDTPEASASNDAKRDRFKHDPSISSLPDRAGIRSRDVEPGPASLRPSLPTSPKATSSTPLCDQDVGLNSVTTQASGLSVFSSSAASSTSAPPACLLLPAGELMLKVTHKKVKQTTFQLDADRGQITWQSKKDNRVNLETIREVRFASSAASYRTSLNISSTHEPRWLTIIYQTGGIYKALHLIALSDASVDRWRSSLLHLQTLRKEILEGVGAAGSLNARRNLWLKHHWKDANETNDEKLSFAEVQKLCRRLGIEKSRANLRNCFEQSDWKKRGYLDFEDFQAFVRLLKRREDVEAIFLRIADLGLSAPSFASTVAAPSVAGTQAGGMATSAGTAETAKDSAKPPDILPESLGVSGLSLAAFTAFLVEEQKHTALNDAQVADMFARYGSEDHGLDASIQEPAMRYEGFLDFLTSSDNPPLANESVMLASNPGPAMDERSRPPAAPGVAQEQCARLGVPSAEQLLAQGQTAQGQSRPTCRPLPFLRNTASSSSLPGASSALPSRAHAETAEELIAAGASNTDSRKLPVNLRRTAVTQDMTRPLSDYYISSSHNTYLLKTQWKGDSTVEGYIRALLQGARSVELDCWDGPSMTPQITHGRTLTSKVPFADVIAAIGRYAFVTSPYPLILSLEVHNDVPQQEVIAKILRETLGDSLLSQRLKGDGDRAARTDLPCPEALKFKILVKAKNLYLAQGQPDRLNVVQPPVAEEPAVVIEAQAASVTDTTTESDSDALLSSARDLVRRVTKRRPRNADGVAAADGEGSRASKPAKVLMSASLAALLVYTVGVKCRGFNKKEIYATEHMISLSEKTALKFIRDPMMRESLVKHNRSHLTRIYPSMSSFARVHASRNFSPLDMWAAGCHLVALNWQTIDIGFELNQAMFARNGRCGYVLKPPALRIKEQSKASTSQRLRFCVDLQIISAQQLPRKGKDAAKEKDGDDRDPINPYVSVSLMVPECWGRQPRSFVRGASTDASIAAVAFGDSNLVKVSSREAKRYPPRSSSLPPDANLASPIASPLFISPSAASGTAESQHSLQTSTSAASLDINQGTRPHVLLKTPTSASAPPASGGGNQHGSSAASGQVQETSTGPVLDTEMVPKPSSSRLRTPTVKGNGFSPRWNTSMSVQIEIPAGADFDLAALNQGRMEADPAAPTSVQRLSQGLLDLCFLRFEVYDDDDVNDGSEASSRTTTSSSNSGIDGDCIAAYAVSVGSLQQGYRHLPLYGAELSQFLFSTLFVHVRMRFVGVVGRAADGDTKLPPAT